ncbi:MAG: hypothetical protein KDA37_00235, partial [Planctomycetales bacterium]|nr:hypothetical protein [Planctomycetales bacterium]
MLLISPAAAIDFTYIGGVGSSWFTTGNWSPAEFGPPTDLDTATIANGGLVLVDHNFGPGDRVDALTLAAGELRTNGYEVIVDDAVNFSTALTLVNGGGSLLRIDPNASGPSFDSLDTDDLTVANGGVVDMRSGSRLEVDSGLLTIGSGSSLKGRGAIDLEASVGAATSLLVNDGALRAGGDLLLPA